MPATPQRVSVEEKDLQTRKEGSYSSLECPGDYEAFLKDVDDYDKGDGRKGWLWHFEIEGLPFDVHTSFSKAARWKLVQVVRAFVYDFFDGKSVADIDPNDFIGSMAGAHIDWQNDPESLPEGATNYREIKYFFNPDVDEEDLMTEEEALEEAEDELEEEVPAVL